MTQTTHPAATLLTPVPGLHATAPQALSFDSAVTVRAFVLERPAGNVLLYSSTAVGRDAGAVEALGGLDRWYLGHWHEAMFAWDAVDAPLFVHEADRARVEESLHVRGAFSRDHLLGDDLEILPIPGHTPGSTAYLWTTGEHRVLFTADSLYLRDGEWVAAVLDSSDREAYVESLERLREVEFDVLAPWAATAGDPPVAFTDPADARRRLGEVIDRVRAGGTR